MAAAVLIVDETSSRQRLREFRLELAGERLTAGELIRRRVRSEVETWIASGSEVYRGLVEPSGAERALNGVRVPRERRLDVEKLQSAALEGFRRSRFLLFVESRQIVDPDEPIELTPDLAVRFVKLVPLVGG